jgi:hypothetical protein
LFGRFILCIKKKRGLIKKIFIRLFFDIRFFSLSIHLNPYIYLDNGTLTPLVRRLIEDDLVEKKRSTKDERKVSITLTEKGINLKERAYNVPESIMPSFKRSRSQGTCR